MTEAAVAARPIAPVPDGHTRRLSCPRCHEMCDDVGTADLVYAFRDCDCNVPNVPHLVEQTWHRRCFARLIAADVLRDRAADEATGSRDFGRGYAHAISVLQEGAAR